jgi:hypothetical protein
VASRRSSAVEAAPQVLIWPSRFSCFFLTPTSPPLLPSFPSSPPLLPYSWSLWGLTLCPWPHREVRHHRQCLLCFVPCGLVWVHEWSYQRRVHKQLQCRVCVPCGLHKRHRRNLPAGHVQLVGAGVVHPLRCGPLWALHGACRLHSPVSARHVWQYDWAYDCSLHGPVPRRYIRVLVGLDQSCMHWELHRWVHLPRGLHQLHSGALFARHIQPGWCRDLHRLPCGAVGWGPGPELLGVLWAL